MLTICVSIKTYALDRSRQIDFCQLVESAESVLSNRFEFAVFAKIEIHKVAGIFCGGSRSCKDVTTRHNYAVGDISRDESVATRKQIRSKFFHSFRQRNFRNCGVFKHVARFFVKTDVFCRRKVGYRVKGDGSERFAVRKGARSDKSDRFRNSNRRKFCATRKRSRAY